MNSPVIFDSSGFISLSSISDSNHLKAIEIVKQIESQSKTVIMPGEIFTEIINVVGKKIGHYVAADQAELILDSKSINIYETNEKIRLEALKKFKAQKASVSFTDCLVMAFADNFDTKDIFGFDEVFYKNGYQLFS